MQERQIFGLIVRTLGMLFFIYSTSFLFYLAEKMVGAPQPTRLSLTADVVGFGLYFVLGLTLLRAADRIVRFAYSPERTD